SGGHFAAIAALVEFAEKFVVVGDERRGTDFALWRVSAECFAASLEIADVLVAKGNAKARAELAEFFFVELLLLVRDVLAFAGFTKTVTFNRAGKNDRRAAFVFDGGFVRGIDFAGIVSTKTQAAQSLVGKRLNKFQETRIAAEEELANVVARRNNQLLVFAVDDLAHALDEKAFGVALEDGIPLAAPKNFDDVPAGTAESGLKFLNDLAIAANRTIEALKIAVDDEDEVVEFFASSKSDGAERFGFIGFTVAEEGPNFCIGGGLQAAVYEIAVEASLINGHERTESHGDRVIFPEIGHEPGMRVGGESTAGLQFAAKVFQLLDGDATFKICARINAGSGVALEINGVAFKMFAARAEEMVEADFVESGGGGG